MHHHKKSWHQTPQDTTAIPPVIRPCLVLQSVKAEKEQHRQRNGSNDSHWHPNRLTVAVAFSSCELLLRANLPVWSKQESLLWNAYNINIYIHTYIHIQILHEYHYISFIIWNTGNSKIPVVNPCFPYKPISIPRVVATVFWSRAWFIVTSSRSQAPSSPRAQHRIQANGTKICILMYILQHSRLWTG
jgi:hypothetical protein